MTTQTTIPVVAMRFSIDGDTLEGWPEVGEAASLEDAIALVQAAGYRVPVGEDGYQWGRQYVPGIPGPEGVGGDAWVVPVVV